MKVINSFRLFALLLLSVLIAACGNNTSEPTTAITGSIFAGPVNGASVTVKGTNGTTIAGPVTTGSDGTYSINIKDTDLSTDLIFEATGGTFTDEATAASTTAGTLSAHISGGVLGTGGVVHVTPSTTIVQKLVAAGKSKTVAETAFNTTFGFTPDSTIAPADAMNPPTGATEAQKLAGLQAAVFSQLTKDLSLAPEQQFSLLTAIANDLSDDSLDGVSTSGTVNIVSGTDMPIDTQNCFEKAFVNFLANSNNQSGLTPDKIGTLPFAKTILTSTYKVTYVEESMKAMQGKTAFKISVKNRSDGSAASGLNVSLTPKMYMTTMSHGTPVGSITDNNDGTYSCVVYYLMASGPTMGYWELQVSVNSETATFYPSVAMSMGDTARVTLRHSGDTYTNMGDTSVRPYFIFRDSLIAGMGDAYTFKVFIGTRETMMSHPALYTGLSMNSGVFTANTVVVSVSTDIGSTWSAMTEGTPGHFSKGGLIGFTSGVQGTILVKLTINGNDYVDDATGTGGNPYASFTVTPGTM